MRLFSQLSILVLTFSLLMLGGVNAAPTTSVPMPPSQPTVAPVPPPIVPVAIKRRWRVNARMRFADGTYRFVYITWYGFPSAIDWQTAAVCEYLTYRFWSPWERMWATFEIVGPPVEDMTTPIN
jgi:hypothetical protein